MKLILKFHTFLEMAAFTRNECDHEDIWGSGGIAPPFLTSELDGSEWLVSCPLVALPPSTPVLIG
jgi:hypothetical protein